MRPVRVVKFGPGHRLVGAGPVVEAGNRFLEHLIMWRFSLAAVRAYAFDVANFAEFLTDRGLGLDDVEPTDLFDYLDWQSARIGTGGRVVALRRRGPAPATMNPPLIVMRWCAGDRRGAYRLGAWAAGVTIALNAPAALASP